MTGDPHPPSRLHRVLVSDVPDGLLGHWEQAIRTISGSGLHPVAMESDVALPPDLIAESSLRMVRESSAYLMILGHRYGYVPESDALNPDKRSLAELQYREARRLGRPVLTMLMGDMHPLRPSDVERDADSARRLAALRAEVAQPSAEATPWAEVPATFDDMSQFVTQVKWLTTELRHHLHVTPRSPHRAEDEPRPTTSPIAGGPDGPGRVFVSYSHRDRKWLDRLLVHLKPLERAGRLDVWADTRITPGSAWRDEIEAALDRSQVALLLVSADFLASDFVAEHEIPALLRQARERGTIIMPVIVSPSRFALTASLSGFQSINPPDTPLTRMSVHRREEFLVSVANAVEDALSSGDARTPVVPERSPDPQPGHR